MKKTFLILSAAVVLIIAIASCATKQNTSTEPTESEIYGTENTQLDGEEWIKTQFFDKAKKPIANRDFEILLVYDDETTGVIYGKSDGNGWVYVKNVPAKRYFVYFYEKTKMTYDCQIISERIELPPDIIDANAAEYGDRAFIVLNRSDGAAWEIEITETKLLPSCLNIEQTDIGFALDFRFALDGGEKGGRLFFRESLGEPCLYKMELAEEQRIIAPAIKISELTADKIGDLLGSEY